MRLKKAVAGMLAGALAFSMLAAPAGAVYDAGDASAGAQSALEAEALAESAAPIEEESVVDAADMAEAAGLDPDQMLDDFAAFIQDGGQAYTQAEADEVDGIGLFSEDPGEPEDGSGYMYLSDRDYDPASWIKYSSFMVNKAPGGQKIQLLVDGVPTTFEKGMGAHASSALVYNISEFKDSYPRLSCYVGVDYTQKGRGNGVFFVIAGSNDLKEWTDLASTGVLLPSQNARYLDIDVSGYDYIRLYADDNGANGNDHAVYGDLRLLAEDYDITSELYQGFDTLEEYDARLSQNTVEGNFRNHRQEVLERAFVARVGYQSIQNAVKAQDNVQDALEWLRTDTNALQLFLEAGDMYKWSAYKSLLALGDLYEAAKDDIGDSGDAYVYKKMMLATAVAYCRDINTYMTGFGGNHYPSDPVVKYTTFKKLYDENRFTRKEEFKTYNMELVRAVMDSKMEDAEILWLRDYSESRYPTNLSARMDPYSFVRYRNVSYAQSQFYAPENMETWDAKYDFLRYGVTYGAPSYFHLWMMMEAGGICWGISGMGLALNEVHGIPAINTFQPQHEAYMVYTQDDKGQGSWTIWNNVSGWASSYSQWAGFPATEARLLLGWGCMDYNRTAGGNNSSYILLAQAALNRYDDFLDSMIYTMVAGVYPAGSARHEEALDRALECLDLNLDALYGKVKSYRADASTTEKEWADLARQVIETYTFYPAPMVDLLGQILPHLSSGTVVAEINTLKTNALKRATAATADDTLQPDACRAVANSLLGSASVELASFSFDGENAGCVVLDPSYDPYELMVRVSLDGGLTWEKFSAPDGSVNEYTPDHIIQLTEDQLARITADTDILVGLTGTSTNYTIDIKNGPTFGATTLYANDNEDLLIGSTEALQYSTDGGKTWADYTAGLDSTLRFEGDMKVTVRYKAHGVYLQSGTASYSFTASQDTEDCRYLPLRYVTMVDYSSQQSTNASHAAANLIDGNAYTAWHTKFNTFDTGKYYVVQFDKIRAITRLTYLPGGQNGRLKSGEVYASMDGQEWTLVKTFSGLANNDALKTIDLDQPVQTRYLKLTATETYFNSEGERNMYFSGKMLNFYEDPSQAEDLPAQITYEPQDPTRENVTATLVLPDGCTADETTFVFEDNGTHTFFYRDSLGREQTAEASVSWIDRTAPTGEIVYSPDGWTSGSVTATLHTDEEVTLLDGSDGSYLFEDNDRYTFRFADAAGNEGELEAEVLWIDKTKPADDRLLTVEKQDGTSTVTLNIDPDSVEVLSLNGTATDSNVLTAKENGTYTFRLRLRETGYEFEYTVLVDWFKADVPAAPTPTPEVVTVHSPEEEENDEPAATPTPTPSAPAGPVISNVGSGKPSATKAPAATAAPTAEPETTATPAPSSTPAPTTEPETSGESQDSSTPEPAPAVTRTSPRWPMLLLGAGLLSAAVVIGIMVFLPGRRRYR